MVAEIEGDEQGLVALDGVAEERREGEIVVIGDENMPMGEIEIVEIQGSRVRVAFRFPDHIRIMRKEIADNWSGKKGNT